MPAVAVLNMLAAVSVTQYTEAREAATPVDIAQRMGSTYVSDLVPRPASILL